MDEAMEREIRALVDSGPAVRWLCLAESRALLDEVDRLRKELAESKAECVRLREDMHAVAKHAPTGWR